MPWTCGNTIPPKQALAKAVRWREEATLARVTRHLWPPSTMRSRWDPWSHLGAAGGVRGGSPEPVPSNQLNKPQPGIHKRLLSLFEERAVLAQLSRAGISSKTGGH